MAERGGNSTRDVAGDNGGSRQRACQKGHDQNSKVLAESFLQLIECVMREMEGGGRREIKLCGAGGRTKK